MEQTVVATADAPSSIGAIDGIENKKSNGKGKGKGNNKGEGNNNKSHSKNKNHQNKGGKGKKNQNSTNQEEELLCILCAEAIDFRSRLSVLAPCGHNDMCSTCALRLRMLHQDKRCPLCNIESESMVTTTSSKLTWKDIDFDEEGKRNARWPGGTFQLHPESGLYMPHSFKVSHFDRLVSYSCYENIIQPSQVEQQTLKSNKDNQSVDASNIIMPPPGLPSTGEANTPQPPQPPQTHHKNKGNNHQPKCHAHFGNVKALGRHLREKHNLQFCSICAEHKPVFCSELKRYPTNNDELEKHITVGDPKGEGFKGHPKCSWCKERFYDEKALTMHYTKNHFCCHLCDRLGIANKWFRDYSGLDAHYSKDHWPCHDPKCKERRFVAFEDEFQLRLHQQEVHRHTSQRNGRGQPNAIASFNYSASNGANNNNNSHNSSSGGGVRDHEDQFRGQNQGQEETSLIDSVHAFPTLGESLAGPSLLTDECPNSGGGGGVGGGGQAAESNETSGVFVPFGRWGDGGVTASSRITTPVEAFPTLSSTATSTTTTAKGKWAGKGNLGKGSGGNKGGKGQPQPQPQPQPQQPAVSWASSRPPTQSSPLTHNDAQAAAKNMAAEFAAQQKQQQQTNNKSAQQKSQPAPTSDDFPTLGGGEASSSGASVKKSKSKPKVVQKVGVLSKLGIPAAATGAKKPTKPSTGLSLVRNSAVTSRGKL
jgi:hypothetical protein